MKGHEGAVVTLAALAALAFPVQVEQLVSKLQIAEKKATEVRSLAF